MRGGFVALAGALVLGCVFAGPAQGSAFVFGCNYSHTLQDDPIVAPAQPGGSSHLHDFIGNETTNALSIDRILLTLGSTNCAVYGDTEADKSAYWFPALEQYGADLAWHQVHPSEVTVYYSGYEPDPAALRAFPAGLKMIGGDAHATDAQPLWKVRWQCGDGMILDASRPQCRDDAPSSYVVRLDFRFPRCWDGTSLDSADHKSHVAYPDYSFTTACPADHPVALPEIQMYVLYPTRGGPPPGPVPQPGDVRLASGGQYSVHADFMEAWDAPKLQALIERCLWVENPSCTA